MLFLICSYALFKRKNKPSKSAECVSILLLVTNTADDVAQIQCRTSFVEHTLNQ